MGWKSARPEDTEFGYLEPDYLESGEEEVEDGAEYEPEETPQWIRDHDELLIALHCSESVIPMLVKLLEHYFGDQQYLWKFSKLKSSKYRCSPFNGYEERVLFDWLRLTEHDFVERLNRVKSLSPEEIAIEYQPGIFDMSHLRTKDADLLWNLITGGGDISQAFEVRPQNGTDDLAYRLFFVERWLDSYWLLVQRGSPVSGLLDENGLINFEAGSAEYVPAQIYRKMLAAAIQWDRFALLKFRTKYFRKD